MPSPTRSSLIKLRTVSVKRSIVPSIRDRADRRLERNPLYPMSGRLLASLSADHEVFSSHHAAIRPARSIIDLDRVVSGGQTPPRLWADGELQHAGGPSSRRAERLLAPVDDPERAVAQDPSDDGLLRLPPLPRLEAAFAKVLDPNVDVEDFRPLVEAEG